MIRKLYPEIESIEKIKYVWSAAGGHNPLSNSDLNIKNFYEILSLLVRFKRIESLKIMVDFYKMFRYKLTQTWEFNYIGKELIDCGDQDIIRLITNEFKVIFALSRLGDASFEIVKLLEELGFKDDLISALPRYLESGNIEPFNYISVKYQSSINNQTKNDIFKTSLLYGHEDIYKMYLPKVGDGLFVMVIDRILRGTSSIKSNLIPRLLLGDKGEPTIFIYNPNVEPSEFVDPEIGIKYITSPIRIKDPMRIQLTDDIQYVNGQIASSMFLVKASATKDDVSLMLRLLPWIDSESKGSLIETLMGNKHFKLFRIVFDTVLGDDIDIVTYTINSIAGDPSIHRRFLQIMARKGYKYDETQISPETLETIRRMR